MIVISSKYILSSFIIVKTLQMAHDVISKNTYFNKIQYSKTLFIYKKKLIACIEKTVFSDKPREKPLWNIKLII